MKRIEEPDRSDAQAKYRSPLTSGQRDAAHAVLIGVALLLAALVVLLIW